MLDRGGPFARQRELGVGGRGHLAQQFGAVDRQHHTGRGSGSGDIDAADRRVGERTAHKRDMQHPRAFEVGGELALAGQEAAVFAAQQRAADPGLVDSGHAPRIRAAAAATALTMLL